MMAVLRFLFVIPFGFIVACAAASFALIWPFLDKREFAAHDPVFLVQAAIAFVMQAAQVGSSIAIPFAVFVLLTEAFGWRSLILHAVCGLFGGFAVIRYAYGEVMPHQSVQAAMMVAGLGFMMVYWIFAGRGAGLWNAPHRHRAPEAPPAEPRPRPQPPAVSSSAHPAPQDDAAG